MISGQSESDTETDLLPDLYRFGFGFKLIIFVFQKSMQILFTDRALPTVRCMDQTCGGGGGGGHYHRRFIWTKNYSSLRVYFVYIPPDWTCTAEMTPSLQVDLVLTDAADTCEP